MQNIMRRKPTHVVSNHLALLCLTFRRRACCRMCINLVAQSAKSFHSQGDNSRAIHRGDVPFGTVVVPRLVGQEDLKKKQGTGHDRSKRLCVGLNTNASRSNDNVIESLDQVGMLFLSDFSRQECSTYTTASHQEFDVPDSPTGHGEEKGFSQTTTTRWRQVTRCVGHEIALVPEHAEISNSQASHFSECTEEPNKGFALLKVCGSFRHGFALLRMRGFSR